MTTRNRGASQLSIGTPERTEEVSGQVMESAASPGVAANEVAANELV